MTLYFSVSQPGFYDSNIHTTLPRDAVEISLDDYNALFAAQAAGKCIVPNDHGRPVAVDPTPVPPPPPQKVSAFQARAALNGTPSKANEGKTLLDDAEALVAGSDDKMVHLAWDYAIEFERKSGLIAQLAPALGLTDSDLDRLFALGASISA